MVYIAIDFDGTIVDFAFPEIGKPVPGAIEFIHEFQKLGAKIILFTVRSDRERKYLTEAVEFLKTNGVELFGVNKNPDQSSWSDSPKVHAHVFIDDYAYGCPLIHYEGFLRPCVNWYNVGPGVINIIKK